MPTNDEPLHFSTMSRSELWHHVAEHHQDQEAFYALVDKVHQDPGRKQFDPFDANVFTEIQREAKRRIQQEKGLSS